MTKEQAIKVAAPYFKHHSVETLFVTEDEQVFIQEQHAISHANSFPAGQRNVTDVSKSDTEGSSVDPLENAKKLVFGIEAKVAKISDKLSVATKPAEKEKLSKQLADAQAELDDANATLATLEV